MPSKIELFHGDCLEVMRDIPDGSIDMILCDLPYGSLKCAWDVIIPFDPLWEQYKRIIKPNGVIALFGSEPFSSYLRTSNIKMYKYDWVWDKTTGLGFLDSKHRPLKQHELISVFAQGGCSNGSKVRMEYNPQGLIPTEQKNRNSPSNILNSEPKKRIELNTEYTNYPKSILRFAREVGLHPTQKPVALCEYLIRTYTNEGETVLDNCAGSFTTAVACDNTNRKWICIEKEEEYCNIGLTRINDNRERLSLPLLNSINSTTVV